MTKLFTKSRFKIALDCPTKLYYASNPEVYANSLIDDPFLKALANGGFQVGALAQCYYPEGIEVKHKDYDKSLQETNKLLKKENVTIFEAAIKFNNLFVRVDILEKKDKVINLIEVKSKSANPATFEEELWGKRELAKGQHSLKGDWSSYVYDVAFQAFVVKKAFPEFEVNSFLMCADKSKLATVEGLNQKFLLKDREVTIIGDSSPASLGREILCKLDLGDVIHIIHNDLEMSERFEGRGFAKGIEFLASEFQKNSRVHTQVSNNCKKCEYRTTDGGKKSGFKECWSKCHGLDEEELSKPLVLDVWNFSASAKALIAGKHLMDELTEADFKAKEKDHGLSTGQRQWLQVEKTIEKDTTPYIDLPGLSGEFSKFIFPLHMIDFETCMAAIPFNKDRRPYEQIAFQFSHHTIAADGTVVHADEYINCTPGEFPNFKFVRALKLALSKDQGTIFKYSNHENTVLNQIRAQLQNSEERDKQDLIEFIESITHKAEEKRKGPRDMVDLLELVKSYYYSPATDGSNSIKYVLPAILNESTFVKKKYSLANYNSKNFKNHQWINFDADQKVIDPYKSLPPVMTEYEYEALEKTMSDPENPEIANGGAALTAYALMQFSQMSDTERKRISEALLRYCELDTLAMVMIYEYWNDLIVEMTKKKPKAG